MLGRSVKHILSQLTQPVLKNVARRSTTSIPRRPLIPENERDYTFLDCGISIGKHGINHRDRAFLSVGKSIGKLLRPVQQSSILTIDIRPEDEALERKIINTHLRRGS